MGMIKKEIPPIKFKKICWLSILRFYFLSLYKPVFSVADPDPVGSETFCRIGSPDPE